MEKIYRLGELFCGAGGLALGAEMAQIMDKDGTVHKCRHEWANDYDKFSCETFIKNITPENPSKVFFSKVQDLDIENLEPIDGLLFGFPCNDYSLVGEHKGIKGEFGTLYSYGIRILNCHNPQFFLAENVTGLSSANHGKTFKKILNDLKTAGKGYILTAHLYKFEQYGVPQTRHRIIIVGFRKDLGLKFRVPAPTHLDKYVSCFEALIGVENVPFNNEKTNHSKTTVERLKYIPQGENAWHPNVPQYLRLNVKNCRMSHIYKRLHKDFPAYTLTGSGGGGTHVYHWEENRALTNRERARLQTFPDDFIFYGSKESVRAQIGHAVPPKGAKIIIEAVLKSLAGIPYNAVPAVWQEDHEGFELCLC